eukprot:CAMPEP_0113312154 /NCGR_PEP_ID=MMETSP0010_2-20120614/9094_1 /TAXON_ID=216773 ORGANISM="Corethron hystrix, Strain 308" /NCGR_SAMPLE_ID=MMETSP0010_2 /ASSEMBLY_ACC=CAM_ASM_000155 /LENGTH=436 /DNA_ID=CAMNT_0000167915 /DNA_START=32 /DNA_END=1342 /DNA_ORIENTATION=+ /assembly_acc=CAM_ASM_000155
MDMQLPQLTKSDVIIGPAKSFPVLNTPPGNLRFQFIVEHYVKTGLCIDTTSSIGNSAQEIVQKIQQLNPCGRFFRSTSHSLFPVETKEALRYTAITLRKLIATSTLLKLAAEVKSELGEIGDIQYFMGRNRPNIEEISRIRALKPSGNCPSSQHRVDEKSILAGRPKEDMNHYSRAGVTKQDWQKVSNHPTYDIRTSSQGSFRHFIDSLPGEGPSALETSNLGIPSRHPFIQSTQKFKTSDLKVSGIEKFYPSPPIVDMDNHSQFKTSGNSRFGIDDNLSYANPFDRKDLSKEPRGLHLSRHLIDVNADDEKTVPVGNLPITSPDHVSSSCTVVNSCDDLLLAQIKQLKKPRLTRIVTKEDEDQEEPRPPKKTAAAEEVFSEPDILNRNDVLVGWPEELEENFCGNTQFRRLVSSVFRTGMVNLEETVLIMLGWLA